MAKKVLFYVAISFAMVCMSGNKSAALNIDPLTVIAASDIQPVTTPDIPMGQSVDKDSPSLLPEDSISPGESELFGIKGGYFHPYLSLQGEYTDNLFNVNDHKTSNFLTVISPGIWFALPRKREIPLDIAINNTSAGGIQSQLKDHEGTDRYQAYAGGGLDFKYYSEDSDLNDTDALLEGMFRYNMKSGLSLQVLDRYTHSQDLFEIGTIVRDSVGRYDSNVAMATMDWVFTEKTRVKFEYSNFWLDYEEDIDSFQNRVDNVLDLYGYYIYSEKTSFFLEYKFVDVAYDVDTANDNTQDFIYGGITWYTTEKLALMAKVGFQEKTYEESEAGLGERTDTDGFALDVQAQYQFTEKTKLVLGIFKNNEESDSTLASDQDVFGVLVNYSQDVSEKIRILLDAGFEQADYAQLIELDRKDDTFYIRPSVHYLFREWLKGEIAYEFSKRDSTDEIFDYDTNTFILNLSLAL